MTPALLTLNIGSSSVKYRVFGMTPDLPLLWGGEVSGLPDRPVLDLGDGTGRHDLAAAATPEAALTEILHRIEGRFDLQAAAHRIVHGGVCHGVVELDVATLRYLRALAPLAPLHQGHNLAGVDALTTAKPALRQFGCFDTAFHSTLDSLAVEFALPAHIRDAGIRRYGFHGLSYAWIARTLPTHLADGRVVAAHLGNGASVCALKAGHSIDTSMGMTALDGLPMGTRCGALDPGAVLYMIRDLGMSVDEVEMLLYHDCGLKGLSGLSHDVRRLIASSAPRARFALDFLIRRTAQQIAAMAVSLGGLDAVVFTGGIGEHAAWVRQAIVDALSFLPPFEVRVVTAQEEREMAHLVADTFGLALQTGVVAVSGAN